MIATNFVPCPSRMALDISSGPSSGRGPLPTGVSSCRLRSRMQSARACVAVTATDYTSCMLADESKERIGA